MVVSTAARKVAQTVDPMGPMTVSRWVVCWVDVWDRWKADRTAVKWVDF